MIYFKEILPNPVGKDTDGEWIRLVNTSGQDKILSGWSIKDASGKTFLLNASIPQGGEIVLEYSITGITLNNNGDTLSLMDESGEIVDTLSYTNQVSDDEIIIANRFIEAVGEEQGTNPGIEELAYIGSGKIISGTESSAIFVALALAVVMGVFVGLFLKVSEDQ